MTKMEAHEAQQQMRMALQFVATRQGRAAMPPAQWANVLSLDLAWMTPAQGKAYIARAQQAGLLVERDGLLGLALSTHEQPPLGFRPDPEADPGSAQPDGFATWLARLSQRTQKPREHVLGMVAAQQARLGGWLTADAAILMVARESGFEVREAARAALVDLTR